MIDRITTFLEKIRSEKANIDASAAATSRLSVKYEGAVEVLEALVMELSSEAPIKP